TARYLVGHLEAAKLAVRTVVGGCGLIVDPPPAGAGGESVPCIALRADMDALRIQDAKSADYRSRVPEVMHACGHDGHTAIVLGAALALADMTARGQAPWPIRWRAIFQPAEETCRGAVQMIDVGALEDVSAILALHMDPSRAVGTIGIRSGSFTADCDELEIVIEGRGGHAARPHESLDPIAAAAQLISSIYLFVPRAIDSHDPVVVTIGQIAGGDDYNVIPDRVEMRGTMRSFGGVVRQQALDHIRQLARGVGEASGTQIGVRVGTGPPSVYNDAGLTDRLRTVARELLGAGQVQEIARPSMGGEDFAHYLDHVPGAMFRLGCSATVEGSAPLHTADFDIHEPALAVGARLLARAVVALSEPTGPLPETTA
ncbi:MAG: amidohydrolase, partial [Phycisphaerae bacterium]|nr:amidohydrolase [Phycisphaerae bacterium]